MAAAGLGSRRKCEEFIREGRVSVDGQIITELGTTADADKQRIELNGRQIPRVAAKRVYIALNKPRGYASTLADPHGQKFVTDLVMLSGRPMLRPVGRLDIETEGLLFLTDDGDFLHHLTHPKFEIEKQYLATVRGAPDAGAINQLTDGVRLDDGTRAAADRARLVGVFPQTETADIELVLHSGRNRVVRRMCSAIGHPIARLVRTRIGFVTTGAIPSGGWRHLTLSEVHRLMRPASDMSVAGR